MTMLEIESKPKIIFIDLDGTALDVLIDNSKGVSSENISTIKSIENKDINIVVSTGRGPTKRTFAFLKQLGLNSCIFWNGSKIIHNGNTIFEKYIQPAITQEIFNELKKYRVSFIYNSGLDGNYYSSSFIDRVRYRAKFKNVKFRKYNDYSNNFHQFKILIFHWNKFKLKKLIAKLNSAFGKFIIATFSGENGDIIEITPAECDKGLANKYYANYLNINPMDCIHIGDGLNDLSTKDRVGFFVAMKNATGEVKNKADIISPFEYKNAGLAKTLNMILGKYIND